MKKSSIFLSIGPPVFKLCYTCFGVGTWYINLTDVLFLEHYKLIFEDILEENIKIYEEIGLDYVDIGDKVALSYIKLFTEK